MPAVVGPFGPERMSLDAPDAAELADDAILGMIARARRLEIDPGDVAVLIVIGLSASLVAYGRAPLPDVLAAIAEAAPAREAALREANARGVEPPSLSTAKLAIAATSCRLH